MKMKKVFSYLMNPYKLFLPLAARGFFTEMDDERYLKLMFRARLGRKLNLDNPQTYNEKLQWLKLNDRNPEYAQLVDKYEVKKRVAELIGEEYIIRTYGVWDRADDIDFEALPDAFVLKTTHDSGSIIVCRNKSELDFGKARKSLEKSLHHNYYSWSREWPYKNVRPRIIAEELIGENDTLPVDYKFFCFNGEIDSVMLCLERDFGRPKFLFFNTEWERLMYQNMEPVLPENIAPPRKYDQMISLVKEIAKVSACPRIDLYNIDGRIYFGEITIFNQAGFDTDISYETDLLWGKKADICPIFQRK